MGGDGQALTNKRSLLERSRLYGVPQQQAQTLDVQVASTHCALSSAPLVEPVVCDLEGLLYCKSVIVNYLLSRQEAKDALPEGEEWQETHHIVRLRDVKEVKGLVKGELRCCITGVTASCQRPFGLFWGCGHVVALSVLSKAADCKGDIVCRCPHPDCVSGEKAESFVVRLFLATSEERTAQRLSLSLLNSTKKKSKRERTDD